MSRRRKRQQAAGTEPCPTCGALIVTSYCAQCGEMRASLRPETIRDFLAHSVEAFTHADGRVLATLRALVTAPGKLHVEYFAGRRKPYLGPLQLFLVLNLAFFLLESTLGWKILSTSLWNQVHGQLYRDWAREMAESVAASKGITLDEMALTFDATVTTLSRSLVILFVPLLALFTAVAAPRRGVVSPLVFAFHFMTYLLLLECVMMVVFSLVRWLAPNTAVLYDREVDAVVSIALGLACGVHAWAAARRAFGQSRVRAILSAIVLVFGLAVSLVVYRFVLFIVTLRAQH